MKKLVLFFLSMIILMLYLPLMVMAQVPSSDNPLTANPFGVIAALETIIGSFQIAWYLGVAIVLFVVVAFLRGKLKLGSLVLKIPKVSDWLDGKGNRVKFWLIIGFTGLGAAFAALATIVGAWTAWVIIKVMLSGLVAGVTLAFTAMGVKRGVDIHMPNKPTKLEVGKLVIADGKKFRVGPEFNLIPE